MSAPRGPAEAAGPPIQTGLSPGRCSQPPLLRFPSRFTILLTPAAHSPTMVAETAIHRVPEGAPHGNPVHGCDLYRTRAGRTIGEKQKNAFFSLSKQEKSPIRILAEGLPDGFPSTTGETG